MATSTSPYRSADEQVVVHTPPSPAGREEDGQLRMLKRDNSHENYLLYSSISALFCWLFGAAAIAQSLKARKLTLKGKLKEARESSKDAKAWAHSAIAMGICVILSVIALIFFAVTEPPTPLSLSSSPM